MIRTKKKVTRRKKVSYVTRAALAAAMGKDVITIDRWRRDGMPRDEAHRKYDLTACIAWRIEREREDARESMTPKNYEDARTRKMAAEAEMAEYDLMVKRNELLTVEEFDAVLVDALGRLRAYGLGIPARWSANFVGLTSKLKARKVLQQLMVEMFEQFHRADDDEAAA